MLGQKDFVPKLFNTVRLEDLVPADNELRQILRIIDFEKVRDVVRDRYSHTGQPSVDPVVIIKMLFIGYYNGIQSERSLAKEISLNLAYRWFLGYDLDEATPNHSVLSKARRRYGVEVFQFLFDEVVSQCMTAGLVNGKQAFVDATLIEANASEEGLIPRTQFMNPTEYAKHMLSDPEAGNLSNNDTPSNSPKSIKKFNEEKVSPTDPDASYTARGKKKGLNYEGHYLVDGANRVIVQVATTNTIDRAGKQLPFLLQRALFRHGLQYDSICADTEYGTQSVYQFLHDQNVEAYIPPAQSGRGEGSDYYPKSAFQYDSVNDTYHCPAGEQLKRRGSNQRKQQILYRASPKKCRACQLRSKCTKNKQGRAIRRLFFEERVEESKARQQTTTYQQHMRLRRCTVEQVFSEAKGCHGLERARFRRQWRVSIQVLLTATVQNTKRLVKAMLKRPSLAMAQSIILTNKRFLNYCRFFVIPFYCQRTIFTAQEQT